MYIDTECSGCQQQLLSIAGLNNHVRAIESGRVKQVDGHVMCLYIHSSMYKTGGTNKVVCRSPFNEDFKRCKVAGY